MAGYVDTNVLAAWVESVWDFDSVDGITASTVLKQTISDIRNFPTADVRENVYGEWILNEIQNEGDDWNDFYSYTCSNCEHIDVHSRTAEVPFCWYCGADMRGKKNERTD